MGGSYAGNLAAWYRLKFPNMTKGCWAASAPVLAQVNWPGYGQMVWKGVATDTAGDRDYQIPLKLYAGYEQLAGFAQDPSPAAYQRLTELFNVCPGTLVSQDDRDMFEVTINTYPGVILQYNNTQGPRLDDIRAIVMAAKTALDAAIDVTKVLYLTVGPGMKSKCMDNSVGTLYRELSDTNLPADGQGNAARTWTWQTCNEFGYFQTATSEFDNRTLYTRAASSRSLWQQVCNDVFGIADAAIGANVAATNSYYGGRDPKGISNIYFSNGELDAWSLLSIASYPVNSREVYAQVAPLGSHCVGLFAEMPGEVPGAAQIRNRALELFDMWGAKDPWLV